ncbi:hypothetical protein GCM10011360_04600 [Primorskyibacter flagellatus]|uniref:VPLPA-CTERM protein sorting domain-containing protein n=1 Tax=Primorskyibacter flagellatus TaxID=1387277 RepID=A0A917EBK8_9RHOB|nr:VPLPA-CTERM sorting domain-containing protein [Primorskyibacter flagellatus]GGE18900.1 hypothetical protein GCM10011360_04600 [Primorskyibacter flagellatus]
MNIIVPAAAVFLSAAQMAGAATVTQFTDRTAFTAAMESSFTETFEDFSLDGGLHIAGGNAVLLDFGPFSQAIRLRGNPNPTVGPVLYTFGGPVTGFGATFNISLNGLGGGLKVEVFSGVTMIAAFPDAITTGNAQFFGFTSDTAFDRVEVMVRDLPVLISEIHTVDDVIFGQAIKPDAAVPLPAGLPLLAGGLAALAALRRRRDGR